LYVLNQVLKGRFQKMGKAKFAMAQETAVAEVTTCIFVLAGVRSALE
jgi:hypothetical protein